MRDQVVADLVAEVLGPRRGLRELLPKDEDPRSEYVTGILAPATLQAENRLEAEVQDLSSLPPEEDDRILHADEDSDESERVVVDSDYFSPVASPQSLPRSVGLSFVVNHAGAAVISVFCSWGRYKLDADQWKREPYHFTLRDYFVGDGDRVDLGDSVSFRVRTTALSKTRTKISLFLVNDTTPADPTRAKTEEHIFQPELRVVCSDGTSLGTLNEHIPADVTAESQLALVYRNRLARARGHMCSAIWKDIDPQRKGVRYCDRPPFRWIAPDELDPAVYSKFELADVRTEFVPCVAVGSPNPDWRVEFGDAPELHAEVLADSYDTEVLEKRVRPIETGYRAWISRESDRARNLNSWALAAEANLDECQLYADRIGSGINRLRADKEARLAFCFAQKAMSIQARWNGRPVFKWHPFQLAFLLANVCSIVEPSSSEREICDLLWFPTGGGKTEAYLAIAAFTIAYRRRLGADARCVGEGVDENTRAGVAVISRYTLRLLAIQQYRRALALVTACEKLRVEGLGTRAAPFGWLPKGADRQVKSAFVWGSMRISIGLWVGNKITPNSLKSRKFPKPDGRFVTIVGAIDNLKGAKKGYDGPDSVVRQLMKSQEIENDGETAQVTSCPACSSKLSIAEPGLSAGMHEIYLTVRPGQRTATNVTLPESAIELARMDVVDVLGDAEIVRLKVNAKEVISSDQFDAWVWRELPTAGISLDVYSTRPSRPGYFTVSYPLGNGRQEECDFEIICANPTCELRANWVEKVPVARQATPSRKEGVIGDQSFGLPVGEGHWQGAAHCFLVSSAVSSRVPIPAYTVDDQIYARCPSLLISTVDKFARMPFEPKAATLFGNVDNYSSRYGYYRSWCPQLPSLPKVAQEHPPGAGRGKTLGSPVPGFSPPDLVIQDELHLIEGPLGSLFGMYEFAIDQLSTRRRPSRRLKYIASTATIRQAGDQIRSLFNRSFAQFPPLAIDANDRFFAYESDRHPLEDASPGRLYVGVCAPGKGAQTPNVRLWSVLLQAGKQGTDAALPFSDTYFTIVGYFNAIRELAAALALFRQDIPQRMEFSYGVSARELRSFVELSSRQSSLELPQTLETLSRKYPDALDAVFATSMFGTGVDVDRLGLMVVHGQPKSTAQYIQASGRVGRASGGLVVTLYRATRPRDLDHYEYFGGYHSALYKAVEPITVAPFSSRCRDRAFGPVAAALLRNACELNGARVKRLWRIEQRLEGQLYHSNASLMEKARYDQEVMSLPELFENRLDTQPLSRRPPSGSARNDAISELDRWQNIAARHPGFDQFVYSESGYLQLPRRAVVLGDAHHASLKLEQSYENTPQTLRDVEETTRFQG